jgi:hypothetical protein
MRGGNNPVNLFMVQSGRAEVVGFQLPALSPWCSFVAINRVGQNLKSHAH